METLYEEIYDIFFDEIKKDIDFFLYSDTTEQQALDIAKSRAKRFLNKAIVKLTLNCTPDVDFFDKDDTLERFNFILTQTEKTLIATLMKEMYFEEDKILLKVQENYFTNKEIKIFSPANERKSFLEMFNDLVDKNTKSIKDYHSRDRLTGKLKSIDSVGM